MAWNNYKTISLIFGLFISLPIWVYLLYQILKRVEATELMMFLFWVYLPVSIFGVIIAKIAEED